MAKNEGNNAIVIRSLSIEDTESLLAFYHGLSEAVVSMFQPFGSKVERSSIQSHLESADTKSDVSIGLVDTDGRIVGHAFILTPKDRKPVFGIGIDESAQGQGWGKKLASSVLDEADHRKMPIVSLTVLKNNERAKAMYEKLGFVLQGEEAFREANDSFSMERAYRDANAL